MKRRNFLGIAALFGLAPLLPKIDTGEEKPIKGIGKPFTPEKFKDNLIEEFEIKVIEFQIPVGHANQYGRWYQITGKGILNGEIVTFKTKKIKEETNTFNDPQLIWINDVQKAKLISVRSFNEPIFVDYFPYDNDGPRETIQGRSETILTCQKI